MIDFVFSAFIVAIIVTAIGLMLPVRRRRIGALTDQQRADLAWLCDHPDVASPMAEPVYSEEAGE